MRFFALAIILIFGCNSDPPNTTMTQDILMDSNKQDMRLPKDMLDGRDIQDSSGMSVPFEPGPTPTEKLRPKRGELTFYQLELPLSLVTKLGEAGIIVSPKGSIALLDIGNSSRR